MQLKNMFDLSGKVAIVTGGGRGIGRFIATGLAEAGANLMLASRKVETCQKVATDLSAHGIKALALKCDMGKVDDISNLVAATMDAFGRVDILVNNAGVTWGAPTLEFPLDKWEKIFDVNVKGVWVLIQKAAVIMKKQGGGKIINISSIFGSRGSDEKLHPAVAYNSSKAAIEVLTKNLALKLAPYHISVNAIAPGFFKTDMMGYVFKPEMKETLDTLLTHIPLGRVGEEDDVKALAVFLASQASDYLTGAIIPLDGGMASG
jgi:NAD(P)-dependent dehydrogenase (short-subunit alcohol dehydrogenase family)